ncbi:MAG: DNA translocase FtsK 4TM domain-containing protein, partial [Lachnospiraceae bacterium]|nr:DNA translocase FtsK 4TM domain-containing protein [Lachnospiraceae bacterium]
MCNFGICGTVGNALRYVMFGLFGLPAYVLPPLAFFAAFFAYANEYSRAAKIKIGGGAGALLIISMIAELAVGRITKMDRYSLPEIFTGCANERNGGGVIAGSLAYGGLHTLSIVGLALLMGVGLIVCTVLITGRSFLKDLKNGGRFVAERTSREMQDLRERGERRRRIQEKRRIREEEERKLRLEQKEDEKVLRRDRKAGGVTLNTVLERDPSEGPDRRESETDLFVPDGRTVRDDVHEITVHRYGEEEEEGPVTAWYERSGPVDADADNVRGNIRQIEPEGGEEPDMPDVTDYPIHERLDYEKEVTGLYISGHPFDGYEAELSKFTNCLIADLPIWVGKVKPQVGGILISVNETTT